MTWRVDQGDCREVMARMEPESVTAIVSDPPYGLGFMGHGWDHSVPGVEFWTEALRVLKPGGMLLAFGGTRTWHRLACAIEDAGFVIRDSLCWLYGSGFPKSANISKMMDREDGLEREVTGLPYHKINNTKCRFIAAGVPCEGHGDGGQSQSGDTIHSMETVPASPDSALWEGYGTALKPAFEPIILAMKPNAGTFAQNARAHGVAGLNIDATRIETDAPWKPHTATGLAKNKFFTDGEAAEIEKHPHALGRWPANVILDEEAGALLDEQSGGASRFFYCAKASRSEREAGLSADGGQRANNHPTVKPLALMRWLCRLVKMPKGTIILDPFCGSGTTGCAAVLENCDFIGIELNPDHANIARKRIAHKEDLNAKEG